MRVALFVHFAPLTSGSVEDSWVLLSLYVVSCSTWFQLTYMKKIHLRRIYSRKREEFGGMIFCFGITPTLNQWWFPEGLLVR